MRVLLKLSGEALMNGKDDIYDNEFVDRVATAIKNAREQGNEIAIVVGAGNIWRGRQSGEMDRTEADRMGMLATMINSICLKDALVRCGQDARVMSSVPMYPFAENYSADVAKRYLAEGKVVVLGGGLGVPFISTDTAGAVRAAEISADLMLMAKNIDYIYTDDPRKNPKAERIEKISATEVLSRNLKAIDATATAFCLSGGMPVRVFGLKTPDDITRAIAGECPGTVITAE